MPPVSRSSLVTRPVRPWMPNASVALCKHLGALAVAPEEKWTVYILRPVPGRVRGVPGLSDSGVLVTLEMMATEVVPPDGHPAS